MALTRQTITFLSIFVLFFFVSCRDVISSSSPSPSPSPNLKGESAAETPISLSELFELALPEIGVQKKAVTSESDGAKVASKQLEGVELKINEFKGTIKKRLADPKTSQQAKQCLNQCEENLAGAVDGVKTSIESIRSNDLAKANVDISAIATNVDTCNTCFADMKTEDREVKALDEWVQGVTGDCLASLKKA